MSSIKNLFAELNPTMVGREDEIRAVIRAAVANEHALFIGDPGTAKSMLCYNLAVALGAKHFSKAVDPHTEPEHIFGPESFKKRMEDSLENCTDGYAADAELVFIDEIFKASSATRSSLLSLLQERVYFNGKNKQKTPLRTLVAASNEIPDNHGDAVYDRFLVRRYVDRVHPNQLKRLLFTSRPEPKVVSNISDWDQARDEARAIPVSDEAADAVEAIVAELNSNKIRPGDRRLVKSINILKAEAWLNGASEVTPSHLGCLEDVLWVNPSDRRQCKSIIEKHSDPESAKVNELRESLDDILSKTDKSDAAAATQAIMKVRAIVGQIVSLPTTQATNSLMDYAKEVTLDFQAAMMGCSKEKLRETQELVGSK